jgi:excisionase family DNA binding protein
MADDPQPLLVSTATVAKQLELGKTKIFELIAAGELESVKVGRVRRVTFDSVTSYVDRLRAEQNPDRVAS